MAEIEGTSVELVNKLDLLIRLVAHQVALKHETLESKAVVLSSLRLKPADIAKICGSTPGTISVRLAEAKNKDRKKKKAKR
jgi:DNA-directed RNA polymerase specialized sigma24 family protein